MAPRAWWQRQYPAALTFPLVSVRLRLPMQAGRRRVDSPAMAHVTVGAAVARARKLWPSLPLFAGGTSSGGRITSQAQAVTPLPAVLGLILLGFPLHPAAKPSIDRASHLALVDVPMLFVHGTRDALAHARPFKQMASRLGAFASLVEVAEADHSFHVPRCTDRSDDEVLDDMLDAMAVWTQAFRVDPVPASNSANP